MKCSLLPYKFLHLCPPFKCLQLVQSSLLQLVPHLSHLDVHDPRDGYHSCRPLQPPVLQILGPFSKPSPGRLDLSGCHLHTIGSHESTTLESMWVCKLFVKILLKEIFFKQMLTAYSLHFFYTPVNHIIQLRVWIIDNPENIWVSK